MSSNNGIGGNVEVKRVLEVTATLFGPLGKRIGILSFLPILPKNGKIRLRTRKRRKRKKILINSLLKRGKGKMMRI